MSDGFSFKSPFVFLPEKQQVMYKGSTNHRHKSSKSSSGQSPNPSSLCADKSDRVSTPSVGGGEENNVLHMKKSAEIAAVFSGAKINQTTDNVHPFS